MNGLYRGLIVVLLLVAGLMNAGPVLAASEGAEWQSGNTLYLAGRDLTIDRKAEGSLTATGDTITVVYTTDIARDMWLAARRVAVEGKIGGDLSIRAQNALINGHVRGSVSFYGAHLSFGPDARIDGDVSYYASSPAQVDANSKIAGKLDGHSFSGKSERFSRWSETEERDWYPRRHVSWVGAVIFGIFAALAAAMSPTLGTRLREGNASTGFTLVVGAAWLFGMPIVALLALFSLIGFPLALMLVFIWPVGVFLGLVSAIVLLGEMLVRSRHALGEEGLTRRMIGIAVATLILWIGMSLPVIGWLVWAVTAMIGIGVMLLATRARVF